jgi:hypothetical protein
MTESLGGGLAGDGAGDAGGDVGAMIITGDGEPMV